MQGRLLPSVLLVLAACGNGGGGTADVDAPPASHDGGVDAPLVDAPMIDAALPPDAPVPVVPRVARVVAGFEHTCALSTVGAVRCWGSAGTVGTLGQESLATLGDQPGEMAALPDVALGTGLTAVAIAAGGSRTCVVLNDHGVKCWGRNTEGQLGIGNLQYRGDRANTMGDNLERIALGTGRTALSLAMGANHTCAILDDHSVKCWGDNGYGQLGIGSTIDRGGAVADMGNNLPVVPLGAGRTALALTAGGQFTCALLDTHAVKCWGRNDYGQLGLGATDNRGDAAGEMAALPAVDFGAGRTVTSLASNDSHTCAVLDTGAVKCWGDNVSGELGSGASGRRGDAPGELGDVWPAVPLGTGRTALAVAVGDYSSCALLDDSQVKCWGYNSYGNLGLGDTVGRAMVSQLGDALPEADLGTGRTVTSLAAGPFHVCAVLDTGALKCFGRGRQDATNGGWLGLGDIEHHGDMAGEMGDALPAVTLW